MNFQVLARKWRPLNFDDVIGQKHVTRSLRNAVQDGRVGHAYVFCGTRGVGKTSLARIFARALRCTDLQGNGNPCNQCPSCEEVIAGNSIDVVEIDGASNNGVDQIRELINEVNYLPTSGKYKIVIIDEVHMLSTSAFNALLKTLEEPPAHVIFLMATTEPEKLLETVLSRCIRFDLRSSTDAELLEILEKISTQEELTFENEYIKKQICLQARGSIRDLLTNLDQLRIFSGQNEIDSDVLKECLGVLTQGETRELVENILSGDYEKTTDKYNHLIRTNISAKLIVHNILDELYREVLTKFQAHNTSLTYHGVTLELAECLWVYEVLAKESQWALEGLLPAETINLLLMKVTRRREIFGEKKRGAEVVSSVKSEPAVNLAEEEKKTPQIKTWEGFLEYCHQASPVTASNLEQGNLDGSFKETSQGVTASVGFKKSASVFFDHLNDTNTKNKVVKLISDYFETEKEKVFFSINLVEDEREEFKSVSQKRDEKEQRKKEEIIDGFKKDPKVLEVESLFNTKCKNVQLNS